VDGSISVSGMAGDRRSVFGEMVDLGESVEGPLAGFAISAKASHRCVEDNVGLGKIEKLLLVKVKTEIEEEHHDGVVSYDQHSAAICE
jgi:hypothetical protein